MLLYYQLNYFVLFKCHADINSQLEERLPTREHHVNQVKTKELDVLVIGGGATGAGCAVDAASRGEATKFYISAQLINSQCYIVVSFCHSLCSKGVCLR